MVDELTLDPMNEAFRDLRVELDGLTDEEMTAFRVENWPRHQHWCGEDGSIGGLLRHLAAWKQALALTLSTGTGVDPLSLGPPQPGAVRMVAWLEESHRAMIETLKPYVADPPRKWPELDWLEGLDRDKAIEVWLDHDRWHRAQIVHLRQRYLAGKRADG